MQIVSPVSQRSGDTGTPDLENASLGEGDFTSWRNGGVAPRASLRSCPRANAPPSQRGKYGCTMLGDGRRASLFVQPPVRFNRTGGTCESCRIFGLRGGEGQKVDPRIT